MAKYDPDEFFSAERPVTLKYAERIQEQYSWQDNVLKITTGIVHEMDKWREMEICNHFDCDLSDFRKWLEKKQANKPRTNADRIRAMSDEELAFILASPSVEIPPWCVPHLECPHMDKDPVPCDECALDWLRQEGRQWR